MDIDKILSQINELTSRQDDNHGSVQM